MSAPHTTDGDGRLDSRSDAARCAGQEGSEALRARLNLRAVLPLLKIVLADRPRIARLFRGVSATVQIEATAEREGAHLRFTDGALAVVPALHPSPTVRLGFPDFRALNRFFAGARVRPRVSGWRHPVLVGKTLWLLGALRVLAPGARLLGPADRALRVKLLLYMATHGLSQLARGGHREMVDLIADSPDRVYQWTIVETGVSAYLRMRHGRARSGRGSYRLRRPFVHFIFPSVDGALRVFTEAGSQMDAVALGLVRTEGSPEYSRKVSALMQQIDQLLTEG